MKFALLAHKEDFQDKTREKINLLTKKYWGEFEKIQTKSFLVLLNPRIKIKILVLIIKGNLKTQLHMYL